MYRKCLKFIWHQQIIVIFTHGHEQVSGFISALRPHSFPISARLFSGKEQKLTEGWLENTIWSFFMIELNYSSGGMNY